MNALTDVERTLLSHLLAGDHPALAVLRRQLAAATVEGREFSAIGFFTDLVIPRSLTRLPVRRWVIGDVEFQLEGIVHGGSALLFVENGAASMLEVCLNGGELWPEDVEGLRAGYLIRAEAIRGGHLLEPGPERDLRALASEYAEAKNRGWAC